MQTQSPCGIYVLCPGLVPPILIIPHSCRVVMCCHATNCWRGNMTVAPCAANTPSSTSSYLSSFVKTIMKYNIFIQGLNHNFLVVCRCKNRCSESKHVVLYIASLPAQHQTYYLNLRSWFGRREDYKDSHIMLFQLPRSKSLQICVACFCAACVKNFYHHNKCEIAFSCGTPHPGPVHKAASIAGAFLANAKLLPFINVEELLLRIWDWGNRSQSQLLVDFNLPENVWDTYN